MLYQRTPACKKISQLPSIYINGISHMAPTTLATTIAAVDNACTNHFGCETSREVRKFYSSKARQQGIR